MCQSINTKVGTNVCLSLCFFMETITQKYLHQIQTLLHQRSCHSEGPLHCPSQGHPHARGRHLAAVSLAGLVCAS